MQALTKNKCRPEPLAFRTANLRVTRKAMLNADWIEVEKYGRIPQTKDTLIGSLYFF